MIFQLGEEVIFPPPAFAEPDGLLAIGGDLNIDRLLAAYSSGIFPWFNPGDPILWWSPDPRPLIFPDKMRVTKSLRRTITKGMFSVGYDTDFEAVINNCATVPRHGQDGTWLTEEMKEAYIKLHRHGYCHSVETYLNGELAGGLYGVTLGKAFIGESMFYKIRDASKVAFYYLCEYLKNHDYHFIDGQVSTPHLLSLGASEVNRDDFLRLLHKALKHPTDTSLWR